MKFFLIAFVFLLAILRFETNAQTNYYRQNVYNPYSAPVYYKPRDQGISKNTGIQGVSSLTASLLNGIYLRAGSNFNIFFSPISIWTILAILLEGSGGKTETELKTKLKVSLTNYQDVRNLIRSRYEEIKKLFEDKNGQTEISALNFLVTEKKIPPEFQRIVEDFYDGKHFNFDNKKSNLFSIMMNNWAHDKSNGKVSAIVSPDMFDNLVMLIGNAVYFKSKWRHPFDSLDTLSLPFKDENDRVLTSVPMMNVAAVFPLTYSTELESQIIEIPYADNLTSMIVILPKQNVSIRRVLSRMENLSLNQIIPRNITEETVQLTLPKFRITSKMYLNEILRQDLYTMFSSQSAEFPRIGKDVFVSKIFHKAEIENSEEGTTASSVTSVQFAYKSSTSIFRADHPFIYFISDIKSRTVLFAGTFSNPYTAMTKF